MQILQRQTSGFPITTSLRYTESKCVTVALTSANTETFSSINVLAACKYSDWQLFMLDQSKSFNKTGSAPLKSH